MPATGESGCPLGPRHPSAWSMHGSVPETFRRRSGDPPAVPESFRNCSESQGPCSSGQGQKPGHAEVSRGTSTAVTGTFAAIPVRSRIAPQRQYQRVADAERRIAGWVARPGSLWTGCGPASGVAYIDCCCLHTVACDRAVLIPDPRAACVHALACPHGPVAYASHVACSGTRPLFVFALPTAARVWGRIPASGPGKRLGRLGGNYPITAQWQARGAVTG